MISIFGLGNIPFDRLIECCTYDVNLGIMQGSYSGIISQLKICT
ncbi:hypothetical protein [uncultured Gammaproteobacteria bacterium]|nr:hypothetical protein [uncultured Gammaproteobacteria bacterium]